MKKQAISKRIIATFLAVCMNVFYTFALADSSPIFTSNDVSVFADDIANIDFKKTDDEKKLYIYVGIDFLSEELVELFSKLSGIDVIVDIFDSNEILEAKLLAGGNSYDVVFPTAFPFFARQLQTGIFKKIDKTELDYNDLDEDILEKLRTFDINNQYCIPFQWGISGIGINEKVVKKACPDAPLDSLAIIFDKKYVSKLAKHGISVYESQEELFPTVLAYLGKDPEVCNKNDLAEITKTLLNVRKYIFKFTNYGFEDLSSGSSCIILGTSGDIKHIIRQEQKKNGKSNIKFILPKEGTSLWIDVCAIPKTSQHPKNATLFLKFLLSPKINAIIANSTSRATCTISSRKYVKKDLIEDKTIYPGAAVKQKSYIEKYTPGYINSLKIKALTKIKVSN